MSKFFVGQRVRIVGAKDSKHLIGTESRLVGFNTSAWDGVSHYSGWVTSSINIAGRRFVAKEHQIEPILPEGAAPSEFTFQQLMDSLQEVSA